MVSLTVQVVTASGMLSKAAEVVERSLLLCVCSDVAASADNLNLKLETQVTQRHHGFDDALRRQHILRLPDSEEPNVEVGRCDGSPATVILSHQRCSRHCSFHFRDACATATTTPEAIVREAPQQHWENQQVGKLEGLGGAGQEKAVEEIDPAVAISRGKRKASERWRGQT